MSPGYFFEGDSSAGGGTSAKERYSGSDSSSGMSPSNGSTSCERCHGPIEKGFLSTTNGSGLYWATEASSTRLRPSGLEVVVPTGFMGTFSANVVAERCRACGTILVRTK